MRPLVISLAITDSSTGASLSSALVNLASSSAVHSFLVRHFPAGPVAFIDGIWGVASAGRLGVGGVGKSKPGSVATQLGSTSSGPGLDWETSRITESQTGSLASTELLGTLDVTQSLTILLFLKASEATSPHSSWQKRCGLQAPTIEAEQIEQLELATLHNSHVEVAPTISPVSSTQSAQSLHLVCSCRTQDS